MLEELSYLSLELWWPCTRKKNYELERNLKIKFNFDKNKPKI